jgi:RNA polymerase sigma factor (sigma-70 family)
MADSPASPSPTRPDQRHHSASQYRSGGQFAAGRDERVILAQVTADLDALAPADRRAAVRLVCRAFPVHPQPQFDAADAERRILDAAPDPRKPAERDARGFPVVLDPDRLGALLLALQFCRCQVAPIRERVLAGEPVNAPELRQMLSWHFKAVRYRNAAIAHNLGVIVNIIRKSDPPPGAEREDLLQVAVVYAVRAVEAFDPGRGLRLNTLLGESVRRGVRTFRQRELGRHRRVGATVSLDEEQGGHANDYTPADRLMLRRHRDRERDEQAAYLREELKRILDRGWADLTDREALLIRQRFRLDGGSPSDPNDLATYEDLARPLKVTRQAVALSVQRGLAKLRRQVDRAIDGPPRRFDFTNARRIA